MVALWDVSHEALFEKDVRRRSCMRHTAQARPPAFVWPEGGCPDLCSPPRSLRAARVIGTDLFDGPRETLFMAMENGQFMILKHLPRTLVYAGSHRQSPNDGA